MKELTDQSIMKFGKYKGRELEDVPASYLLWFYHNTTSNVGFNGRLRAYIEENLDVLEKEVKDERNKS